ncbi:MFS transporter [Achromobacter sp. Bel]|uniref:MFS transporter n=1 Tax=Achromobacter sp. Bel TaxID=2727415 RepID=UPI00145DBC5D|nr:MFS transporter [Achromobacter sp. Bel]NMK48208.1 MHS family MFS transporter [Achromobacter sp. Bel]
MAKQNEAAVRRVVTASLIGATIEWYDFFLYGVVAGIVFNKLYFPTGDPLVSTMLAYTTFAVGFVTRPLGGLIFGHFGDRIGRKSMLVMTLMIMGVSTFLIGLVPTYDSIGVWAPILLLLLRVFQGIGLGGEWGGAVLMAYEYAPPGKKGFYASLPQIGLAIGLCLASGTVALLSTLLTDAQFMAWGWRIAFLASAAMVLVGMYIRLNIKETPEFTAVKESNAESRIPFFDMLKRYPGNVFKGMGARYIDGVFFNVFGVFSISYLTQTVQITRTEALTGVMAAALVMCFFIPFFGRLSDRIGRARVYFWGSLITAAASFPGFWLMLNSEGSVMLIWLAIIIPFGIFYAAIYGPEAALFCELFDAKVRYTGISFVYQFSGIFASGITPIIATALLKTGGGQPWLICLYVLFAGGVSALCAWLIGRGRPAEEPASQPASQTAPPLARTGLRKA